MDFSNVMVSSSMIDPDSLNFNQKALYVTALNYLLRGERIQYDDSRLSSIGGAEFRWKKGVVSPESYTADEWGYTNCAAFCYDLYLYALGFDIGSYTTSGLIGKTSWRTYYYQPKGEISTEQATEQMTKFFNELTPGDLIIIRRDNDGNGSDDSGHVMCYIGNGKVIHCSGSSYQYDKSAETYEPSIRFMDIASYLFDPNASNYVFDSNVSKLAIVRPLKSYKGTIPEESVNRVNSLAGIRVEKLSSCKPAVSVNLGDEITFTFNVLNANDMDKTICIKDVIPENTEFVSIFGGTEENGDISFELMVGAYESVSVSYTVKVKNDVSTENQEIRGDMSTVNGVSVACHTTSIRKTLTADEQARIKEAIAYFAENNEDALSGIAMINAIYERAGLVAPFASTDTFKDVAGGIIGKSTEVNSAKAVAVLENGKYRSIVVDGLYGGRYYYTKDFAYQSGQNRVRLPREHNLVIGDVIIAKTSTTERVFIYDGTYIYNVDKAIMTRDLPAQRLEWLMGYQYYFVVVRPSFAQ
jgi:uncharacterized repeat protein (TIGR01451 family)